ncbi:MAG: hypothetical protein EOP84_06855 [Verrucomicrobiaceae bacterium]|nr:MAG: hypothetical protein EOP84_06855 [Verrucomicrobiaceae bacterium]
MQSSNRITSLLGKSFPAPASQPAAPDARLAVTSSQPDIVPTKITGALGGPEHSDSELPQPQVIVAPAAMQMQYEPAATPIFASDESSPAELPTHSTDSGAPKFQPHTTQQAYSGIASQTSEGAIDLDLQSIAQALKTVVQGALDSTEMRRSLFHHLNQAEEQVRSLAGQVELACQQNALIERERETLGRQVAKLEQEKDERAAQILSLEARQKELESWSSQVRQELLTSTAALVPEAVLPHYPAVLQWLSPEGQVEVRFQLHTLRYLSQQSEPNQGRMTETIVSLSKVLCSELESQQEIIKTLRSAINSGLPEGFSIVENDPGDPIEERFMTGAGLQGCRTVASVRSWAVLKPKEGIVLRKAEIVPAP